MEILKKIVGWSAGRPSWQRDALRRLVSAGEMTPDDYAELTELCKARYGLAEGPEARPLAEEHIAVRQSEGRAVTLASITHHQGVNALAREQTVSFAPGLTIVYGDNAAGKSGYTRILKTACRARGAEEILGNVLTEEAPPVPSASIRFHAGADSPEEIWPNNTANGALLGKVSVFDSHCAAVYLKEKTDVAFRPFGLDLFDKLSNASEEVRKRLERERNALSLGEKALPEVPEGTSAHTFLTRLSSLSRPDAVDRLGTLSGEESARLRFLAARLADIRAQDPVRAAAALELRARRLEGLIRHLERVSAALNQERLEQLFAAQETAHAKQTEAQRLRELTFPDTLLAGTGAETWMTLWEAARIFSEEQAYPGEGFPFTGQNALCLLCQQELAEDGKARLRRFAEFMVSRAEEELRAARTEYAALHDELENLSVENDVIAEAKAELRLENAPLADALEAALETAKTRQAHTLEALPKGSGMPLDLPHYQFEAGGITALVAELQERAAGLKKATDAEEMQKLEREHGELRARLIVGENAELIKGEIERKKKIAAYGQCLEDTQTYQITRMSTELTKETVTDRLKGAFNDELTKLKFRHVEVELRDAGGERGSLYHKVVLRRAPDTALPKVASEGEQRCLSIAAFFAELVTADDPSAILFDDPVSSLDHKWRSAVAKRLAEEAGKRQVIVFTHDIVFLLALHRFAEKAGVPVHDQHLRQDRTGAGVCDADLPWDAMKVGKRIGVLNRRFQDADKLFRDGEQQRYEREAISLYGALRETWERAFEEILLGGTVERYRANIQTQQVRRLANITEQDCAELEAGMEKSSKWLEGHDQAPAENEDIPEPEELRADIDSLIEWVKKIRARGG